MLNTPDNRFDSAAVLLGEPFFGLLCTVPADIKQMTQEIRLRLNKPLCLWTSQGSFFVGRTGAMTLPSNDSYIVTLEALAQSFKLLCGYSVHTHQHEICQGFISVQGGHRAGVCGTAVYSNGEVHGLRNITSINLRIAREVKGCANHLADKLFSKGLRSVLIAGPPSSGKTTVLRDIARLLSSGYKGSFYKVAVVDERCELGAVYQGQPQNDLGICCDLLDGFPKAEGILQAVRTLSPQVIICDEVGCGKEILAVEEGLNSGVCTITSIHAHNMEELLQKPQGKALLHTQAFQSVVFLGCSPVGQVKDICNFSQGVQQKAGTKRC